MGIGIAERIPVTTTMTRALVLYYRRCVACRHQYATKYPNKKCPRCHATGQTYGLKVDESRDAGSPRGGAEAS